VGDTGLEPVTPSLSMALVRKPRRPNFSNIQD
jgi:hypothetical protein